MEANQQSMPVEIDLPAGSYSLKIVGAGEDNSAKGDLDIRRTLLIKGEASDSTVITGNGLDGTDRLMQILDGASATLQGITLDGGNTGESGGGIQVDKGGTLEVLSSALTGSAAARGGGISNEGTLKLEASVIFGNTAGECGGGLYNSGKAELTNVTLFQNVATPLIAGVAGQDTFGGGICNDGDLHLESVTLANNATKGFGENIFNNDKTQATTVTHNTLVVNGTCIGKVVSRGFNLAGANSGECLKFFQAKGDGQTDQVVVDSSLGNNGGHILSLALIAESPALDAGDPSRCPATDMRGFPRKDGRCDVGAYEAP
jgi:hypothetical protein